MIIAVLQARVSSTRLPGKVLKPILGKPMLLHQIGRVSQSKSIDKLIVATSIENSDDSLAELCEQNGIMCFRGSLDDVLDRFYKSVQSHKPTHVIRLTGDCPLADPEIIDQVVQLHIEGQFDYTTNALEPTYPDGLDVEVMRFSVLERAWKEASLQSQREHVTLFINQQPDIFKIGIMKYATDLSHLRWTVDEPQDFELVCRIYDALYREKNNFSMQDILMYLENNPGLKELNTEFQRNEGLIKSLNQEKR